MWNRDYFAERFFALLSDAVANWKHTESWNTANSIAWKRMNWKMSRGKFLAAPASSSLAASATDCLTPYFDALAQNPNMKRFLRLYYRVCALFHNLFALSALPFASNDHDIGDFQCSSVHQHAVCRIGRRTFRYVAYDVNWIRVFNVRPRGCIYVQRTFRPTMCHRLKVMRCFMRSGVSAWPNLFEGKTCRNVREWRRRRRPKKKLQMSCSARSSLKIIQNGYSLSTCNVGCVCLCYVWCQRSLVSTVLSSRKITCNIHKCARRIDEETISTHTAIRRVVRSRGTYRRKK